MPMEGFPSEEQCSIGARRVHRKATAALALILSVLCLQNVQGEPRSFSLGPNQLGNTGFAQRPVYRVAQQPEISSPGERDGFWPDTSAPSNTLIGPEGNAPPPNETPTQGVPLLPRERVPMLGVDPSEQIRISEHGDRLTLIVREAPLGKVLAMLAQHEGLNIVASDDVTSRVSITLRNVTVQDALTSILSVAGYTWTNHNGIIHVTSVSGSTSLAPHVQGRDIRMFELDYAAAQDLEPVVRGLLSPVGKVFVNTSSPVDNRRTKEVLVVEDVPHFMERIESYILQIDQPPRQVLIEARVLQIELSDDCHHGVNWDAVIDMAGGTLGIKTVGLADPAASPSVLFSFNSNNLKSIIECLETTNDIKTLASPKVLVINGQEARIQVGEQLGFRVTTTTETSTLESVNFLDVGVVLRVIPRITREGQVMMHVKPEVSSGQVNVLTGLPEEKTTEVETHVLLNDGQGVVIGGLIDEKYHDQQSKAPWLGDWWLVGRLFQKRKLDKSRSEIVIALIPRVVCQAAPPTPVEVMQLEQAFTPLYTGPLVPTPRPWEPVLYDAVYNPMPICEPLRRIPPPRAFCCEGPCCDNGVVVGPDVGWGSGYGMGADCGPLGGPGYPPNFGPDHQFRGQPPLPVGEPVPAPPPQHAPTETLPTPRVQNDPFIGRLPPTEAPRRVWR